MSRPYINAVYYPNWRVYKGLPPSALQVQCITHIYYAFVGVTKSGEIKLNDEWADLKIAVDGVNGCIAAVAQIKRNNPGIKTMVTFGGGEGSGPFAALAASSRARSTFAAQARNFVDTHGFDGVDIDWEQPSTPSEGQTYLALMQSLRAALPNPRYVLTTALPCGEWALRNIPLSQVAPLIDYVNLMSYDFSGPWTPAAGHQAQLRPPLLPSRSANNSNNNNSDSQSPPQQSFRLASGQTGVSYLLAHGVHPSKVALGIPAYARSFAGARAPGDAYSAAAEVDYRDLPESVDGLVDVDEDAGAACYVDDGDDDDGNADGGGGRNGSTKGRGFVTLDTPATVRLKARYARANRLAGLFYWHGVGDVHTPGRSLVAAGWQELRAPYSD